MQIKFTFKHMETSSSLEKYARTKIDERVLRWVTKPIDAHIYFDVEREVHRVKCTLKGGDGFNFEVEALSGDMYGSLDILVDKLAGQLRRQKEKIKNHKGVSNIRRLPIGRRTTNEFDSDSVSIDAEDLIKYEVARQNFIKNRAS